LLSSVFFGSTIEIAFILANQALPATFPDALLALRKVRQIDDELVDLDEDIQHGIITYPYLHCLSSVQWRQQLAKNIQEIWQTDLVLENEAKLSLLAKECRTLLQQAGSFVTTALVSVTLLNRVAKAMMDYYPVNKAFEITLLLNQRSSHLSRLEQNQWQEIPNVYQPDPFALPSSLSERTE
jgi:hypothetical protein